MDVGRPPHSHLRNVAEAEGVTATTTAAQYTPASPSSPPLSALQSALSSLPSLPLLLLLRPPLRLLPLPPSHRRLLRRPRPPSPSATPPSATSASSTAASSSTSLLPPSPPLPLSLPPASDLQSRADGDDGSSSPQRCPSPPYPYEPHISAACDEAFEATGWAQRLESKTHPHTLRGLRTWSNSTHWPLPSHHTGQLQVGGGIRKSDRREKGEPVGRWKGPSEEPPLIFAALDGYCHATQTDFPRRSHGRLPYLLDPYAMARQNSDAVLRLLAQSQTAEGASFLSTGLHNPDLTSIPVEVSYEPLDYADPQQCAVRVDHEYVVDSRWTGNAWHTFGDWMVPLQSLLHDPCFPPAGRAPAGAALARREGVVPQLVGLRSGGRETRPPCRRSRTVVCAATGGTRTATAAC